MSAHSQRKGRVGERQLRDQFTAAGIPVRLHGIYEAGDLTVNIGGSDLRVETKWKANGFATIYSALEGNDMLVLRADRKEPLIVRRLSDDLKLFSGWQEIATAPKDGTWVLLYWPTMPISFYPFVGCNHDDGYGWEGIALREYGEVFPTLWHTIPKSPVPA